MNKCVVKLAVTHPDVISQIAEHKMQWKPRRRAIIITSRYRANGLVPLLFTRWRP